VGEMIARPQARESGPRIHLTQNVISGKGD